MNQPQQRSQDIDSRTGKTVNPGEPVQHQDVEDGQSVGHSAEPEEQGTGDKPDTREVEVADSKPPRVSRDEIYQKAAQVRDTTIENDLGAMDEDQRKHYQRMVAEAGGGEDPFAEGGDQPQQTPQQPGQPPNTQQQPPQQPAQAQPQPGQESVDPNDELVSIVVYGMREDVPRSVVDEAGGVVAYQKQRAADEKLKRLTTYEASVRDYDRQVAERAARLERGYTPARTDSMGRSDPSPTDDPDSAVDENELARKVASSFFSGDEEQAVKSLAESFAKVRATGRAEARAPQTQPQQGTGQVQPPATDGFDYDQRAREEANYVFATEFGDLQAPTLKGAVFNMAKQVAAEPLMRGRPLAEITREAATRVRNDLSQYNQLPGVTPQNPLPAQQGYYQQPPQYGQQPYQQPGGVQQPSVPTDLGGRMQLKSRTVVTPVNEASAKFQPKEGEGEKRFPTRSEVVENMKRARGQLFD